MMARHARRTEWFWLGVLVVGLFMAGAVSGSDSGTAGLTAVGGLKVGHHTLSGRPTGCTVVLAEAGAVAGVSLRGPAPGTRETALLSPTKTVQEVHAIVLSGGSAFGLDAASGVMRFLDERGIGFPTSAGPVPIVPAAILFDLGVGKNPKIRPGARCGYRAAANASFAPPGEGSVGAGAGATVGKLRGPGRAMKGGIGSAAIIQKDGLVVAALVAVNAVGDVVDPATGEVLAGVRSEDGKSLADARKLLFEGAAVPTEAGLNTTLGIVATNARLTQAEAAQIAQRAHDGLARTIYPVHTPFDGDTFFALATGSHDSSDLFTIGALAAEVTARAVVRAVKMAEGVAGFPAMRDLD